MSKRRRHQTDEGRGERFQVTLTDIGHRGVAIARRPATARDAPGASSDAPEASSEEVVLVSHGIPGETVVVEVGRRHRDYTEARVVAVVEPSPHRVAAPCRFYEDCGGCQWQHIDYEHQVELKRRVVADQLRRVGHFPDPPVAPTLRAPDPWHYRNHARFTVNKDGRMGFVRHGTHRVVPIDECLLMDPWINETIGKLEGLVAETRQMSVRYGVRTGEHLVQPRIRNPALTMETGQAAYHEELLGHRFRVASPAFFQVNTQQAEQLIGVAARYLLAGDGGRSLLVDAYAGVGTFAALLARSFKRVIAVEESGPAVKDARENTRAAGNVEVLEGKVEEVLPGLEVRPDAVLLDPPRAGCHRRVLEVLAEGKPGRVVYVSCDPATLARDLRVLCDLGFTLEEVQPVDMFPQTYHTECVASLSSPRRGEG